MTLAVAFRSAHTLADNSLHCLTVTMLMQSCILPSNSSSSTTRASLSSPPTRASCQIASSATRSKRFWRGPPPCKTQLKESLPSSPRMRSCPCWTAVTRRWNSSGRPSGMVTAESPSLRSRSQGWACLVSTLVMAREGSCRGQRSRPRQREPTRGIQNLKRTL